MTSLYLDPFSGIAGDMFLGLLTDLGAEKSAIREEMDLLGINYGLQVEKVNKNGIMATSIKPVFAEERASPLSLDEIDDLVGKLDESVGKKVEKMVDHLAKAESRVHGVPLDKVHFHELGSYDAVIELTGVVTGLEVLGVDRIYSGPVNVGSGFVTIEHGRFPVPAPATADLLKGIPIRLGSGEIQSELVTPTGAVMLSELVDSFREVEFSIEEIGYGAGDRSLSIPNVLRGFLGREQDLGRDHVTIYDYHFADEPSEEDTSLNDYSSIGHLSTPYEDKAPYQSVSDEDGEFSIALKEEFVPGLAELDQFQYIYVLYGLHRVQGYDLVVEPPWREKSEGVGLFASRSPNRPNPVGLSVVKLYEVKDNQLFISNIDAFDGSPVLDIKPYVEDLDSKEDAGKGWLAEENDIEHLQLHLKGIPH